MKTQKIQEKIAKHRQEIEVLEKELKTELAKQIGRASCRERV